MIQLIKNKSYVYLLPLLDLPNIYSKIRSVTLYNSYDTRINGEFSKRIYILTYGLEEDLIVEIEKTKGFIKKQILDENILLLSFAIPKEFVTDVHFVSIGDYTKTSKAYKERILSYYKDNASQKLKLDKVFNPTEKDYKEVSRKYMLDDVKKLTKELGLKFDNIEETFHLSNLMK